jgi:fluoroacetyl-CoA thioesterase
MEPSANVVIGVAAAVSIVVTPDMTVGHFVPGIPRFMRPR